MQYASRRRTLGWGLAFAAALMLAVTVSASSANAQSLNLAGIPIGGGDPEDAGQCFGRDVTIAGSNGPDTIVGTFGTDVIKTGQGTDVVRGEGDFAGLPSGDTDFICLGDGNDVADGAAEADFIHGGTGDDILDGDNFPSPFGDTLIGGVGNDTFTGGQGPDIINGGPGNDLIDPAVGTVNDGADTVNAGSGNDVINEALDGSVDDINAGPGNDICVVDPSDEVTNCETVIEVPPDTQLAQDLRENGLVGTLSGLLGIDVGAFGAPGSLERLGLL